MRYSRKHDVRKELSVFLNFHIPSDNDMQLSTYAIRISSFLLRFDILQFV